MLSIVKQKNSSLCGWFDIIFVMTFFFYSVTAAAAPPGATSPPIDLAFDTTTDYQRANLNEIKSKGGAANPTVEFVEVKILIDNTDIAGWEICFSDNPTKESCTAIGVGNGTWYSASQTTGLPDDECPSGGTCTVFNANTWITYVATNVKADAGEVLLRSSVGAETGSVVLDYIRYDGTPGICGDGNERWNITDDNGGSGLDITRLLSEPDDFTACSACFDARDPNQKDFARATPDGSGDWGNNGDTPTEGTSNETSGGTIGAFNITVTSPGSTCSTDGAIGGTALREPVIIEAVNNGGNTLTNYNNFIDLTTLNNNGNWYTTDGNGFSSDPAQGPLSDTPLDDDGAATYQFVPGDGGIVTLYLDNQHAETITISVQETGDVTTLSTSTNLVFSDNVFVADVIESNAPFNALPDKLVPVAGRPHQLQIQMIRRDTSLTPNDCGPASNYNVPLIKAWFTAGAEHPVGATSPSLSPATTPNPLTTAIPVSNNFPVSFSSGVASFQLITSDVGQFILNFQDDSNSFADVGIISDPITFTVRPFGFDLDTDNLRAADWTDNSALDDSNLLDLTYAADEDGSVFAKAGEDFTVTVTAVQWESGDDVDDDGVPQAGANLTDNAATNSFGNETTPATVDIIHAVTLPTPTPDTGTLLGGSNITGFINGAANATLSFDEVGIIALTATHSNYLSTSKTISGNAPNYGRFTPYVFEAVPNTPVFDPGCGSFSYIGQPFTYASNPVINLTAKAKGLAPAFGTTTQNYTGAFFKLTDAKLLASGNKTYAAASGTLDTIKVDMLAADPIVADTGAGTATLTFSDGGGIAFNRGNPEDPFDADIALSIEVFDEDDVFAGDGTGSTANPVSFGTATAGNGIAFTGGNKEQRWGRLVLGNAFGSELLPLEIPVSTEYQSAGDFINNTDDSCTPYTAANITYSNTTGMADPTASGAGTLINGVGDPANPLLLDNTLSEIGSIDFTHSTDFWLKDDRDGIDNPSTPDGDLYDDDPSGRATWGIFAGPKEFIYIREPW
jgi:hypothetical protein